MRYFLLFTLFGVINGSLIGQSSLSFQLKDEHTDLPVPGAHVSLFTGVDTLYGVTNFEGIASFQNVQKPISLKVSHIIYESVSQSLNSTKASSVIYLRPIKSELEEVVVTGQTGPVLTSKAIRQVRVINQERIEQQAAVNLADLLTNDLNFRISQDGVLGSQLSLQGLSGNGVKILIDGVPVIGRLDGNIDISQINLNNIERVEVVEGPMSIQFGTDAVAGTINLISKKESSSKISTQANAYYESVGRYNVDGSVNFPIGKTQGNISLGRNYFNGFSEDDSDRNLQWNPKEQYFASLNLRRRFNKLMLSYRGDFFDESITSKGAVGSIDSVVEVIDTGAWKYPRALDDFFYTTRINNSLSGDYFFNDNMKLKAFVAYNHYRREKKSYITNLSDGSQILMPGVEAQDTTVFGMLSSRLFFQHTLDSKKLSYQVGYDLSYETNIGERIEEGGQDITDAALFTTFDYLPVKSLTIQPGLRYAYNSQFEAPLITSLALRYQASEDLIVRASYGEGFRAPTLKELYFFFVDENHNIVGNESLEAETSNNYQLSLNYRKIKDKWSFESNLAGFYNDIRNEIRLVPLVEPNDDDPRGFYTNQNLARTQTTGANFSVVGNYSHWKIEMGASLIGVRNNLSFSEVAGQGGEDHFLFYPQYRFNISHNLEKIGLLPSLFINHTGQRSDLIISADDQLSITEFEAYTMADLMIQKQFWSKKFIVSAGVRNLFDLTSIQSSNRASGGTHSSGGGGILLGYGRTAVLKLQLRL